jgi:hypothetical protein
MASLLSKTPRPRAGAVHYCARVLVAATAACGPGNAASRVTAPESGAYPSDASLGGEHQVANAPNSGSAVNGTVLDIETNRPLAGRSVSIGLRRTQTDANGRFTIAKAPAIYDVVVVDPDGSMISVYRGVRRRDPILSHKHSDTLDLTANQATVTGMLSGGGPYPLGTRDMAAVYFFSQQADGHASIGGGIGGGPSFGSMGVLWHGSGSLSGQLVALGMFNAAGGRIGGGAMASGGYSAWFASQPLTLSAGDVATVNVALSPVIQGHISASVHVPVTSVLVEKRVLYRVPIVHALLYLVNDNRSSTPFDYMVADLSALKGGYCVQAATSPQADTLRCGLTLGEVATTVTVQVPPSLLNPVDGATVMTDTQFSWTPFDTGVYALDLVSWYPGTAAPSIQVFTADTTAIWPDLSSVGVSLPVGARYRCTIGGRGPYATMDDALGPDGIGAPFAAERRRGSSRSIGVMIASRP